MKKLLYPVVFLFLAFAGCDYVDVPQQAGGNPVIPSSDTVRRILLEDFTGHTCINCPDAARMMDSLQQAYPGQIVGLAIHYGFFAEPCPPHPLPAISGLPSGAFSEDFRTPENTDYNAVFQADNFAQPSGMINHFGFPTNDIPTQVGAWPSLTATTLALPISAYLKITPTYNNTTRALNVTVDGLMMVDTTGTYKLVIMLVEDSLIGCQLDDDMPSGYDSVYVFNHVLRTCLNTPSSIAGTTVISGTIAQNTAFSYTLPTAYTLNTTYNEAHCRLVAYLYNATDHGVLQAAEADIQ